MYDFEKLWHEENMELTGELVEVFAMSLLHFLAQLCHLNLPLLLRLKRHAFHLSIKPPYITMSRLHKLF